MLVSEFLEASADKFPQKEIIRHVAGRLESYRVPKFVVFRKDLPRSSHGKVFRKELG